MEPAVTSPLWSILSQLQGILLPLSRQYPMNYVLCRIAIALVLIYCLIAQREKFLYLVRLLGRIKPLGLLAERVAKTAAWAWARVNVFPGIVPALHGFLFATLLTTAAVAMVNYLDYFNFRYGRYLNAYEHYHYYLGTKYAQEIGYTGLYAASLIADDETGRKYNNDKKSIRNLATGGYINVDEVLKNRDQYKSRFSPERWQEWLKDVSFFKKELVAGRWNGILRDKGYNASPVWTMVIGGLLTTQISTDSERGMNFIACVDLMLISTAFLCVWWAFGARAALLMLILLGTHYMMHFSHMKGALVRTDFAMALVIAVCMLKKQHYMMAGALCAYSILARIFPGVFLFGLGAKFFWELFRLTRVAVDTLHGRYGYGAAYWRRAAVIVAPHVAVAGVMLLIASPILAGKGFTQFQWVQSTKPEDVVIVNLLWPLWLAGWPVLSFGLVLLTSGAWGLTKGLMNTRYLHYFGAFAVTVALLVGGSIAYAGGTYLWEDFGSKIGRHNNDISPWRVGVKYLFIGRFKSDLDWKATLKEFITGQSVAPAAPAPGAAQKAPAAKPENPLKKFAAFTRSIYYKEHPGLWWSIQAVALVVCLFALKGIRDDMALAFSFVPTFFMVSPTYYYYIMLLVPMLFFSSELERPSRALGLVWMYFTAMAGYYFYYMWKQDFPTYYWLSWMILVMCLYMVLLAYLDSYWFSRRSPVVVAASTPDAEPVTSPA